MRCINRACQPTLSHSCVGKNHLEMYRVWTHGVSIVCEASASLCSYCVQSLRIVVWYCVQSVSVVVFLPFIKSSHRCSGTVLRFYVRQLSPSWRLQQHPQITNFCQYLCAVLCQTIKPRLANFRKFTRLTRSATRSKSHAVVS